MPTRVVVFDTSTMDKDARSSKQQETDADTLETDASDSTHSNVDCSQSYNVEDSIERHVKDRPSINPMEGTTKPNEEQVRQWRKDVRTKIDAPDGQGTSLSLAVMACSAPKLTIWQKFCTTFFICCHALNLHPRRFLIGDAKEQVTIAPGTLRNNGYQVPRVKRMADHLKISVDECYDFTRTQWTDACDRIVGEFESFYVLTGQTVDYLSFPEAPTRDALVGGFNFCRNFLWNLWVSWPKAEKIDVWNDMMEWVVQNLRGPVYTVPKFKKIWRDKVDHNLRLQMEADGAGDNDQHNGNDELNGMPNGNDEPNGNAEDDEPSVNAEADANSRTSFDETTVEHEEQHRKNASKRKRFDCDSCGSYSDPDTDSSSDSDSSSTDQSDGGGKRRATSSPVNGTENGNAVVIRGECICCSDELNNGHPLIMAACCGHYLHLRCFAENVIAKENVEEGDGFGMEMRCIHCRNISHKVEVIPGGDEEPVGVELAVYDARLHSRRAIAKRRIETVNGLRDSYDRNPTAWETEARMITIEEDPTPAAHARPNSDKASNRKSSREGLVPRETLKDGEVDDQVISQVLASLDTTDPCLHDFLVAYRGTPGMSKRRFNAAVRGIQQTYPINVWTRRHSSDRMDTTPPLKESLHSLVFKEPGVGFICYGMDCMQVMEIFLFSSSYRQAAPPRWHWDYTLDQLMKTIRIPDEETNRFAKLVCLILSGNTKDGDCIKYTAELHRKQILTVEAMASTSLRKIKRTIRGCGYHRKRARFLQKMAKWIQKHRGGKVPDKLGDLLSILGVGRKTAILTLNEVFGQFAGIGCDVHVSQVSQALGFMDGASPTPKNAEIALRTWLPERNYQEVNKILGSMAQLFTQDLSLSQSRDKIDYELVRKLAKAAGDYVHKSYHIELLFCIIKTIRVHYKSTSAIEANKKKKYLGHPAGDTSDSDDDNS